MAEPSILGALRDPQFRSDTLRNLVEALNGAKRSLTVGSLGAVGDMGNTLANLVRAGAGTAYHETTGRPIPQALEYRDPARDFGTSASLGNFAESQGWLPPQTYSMPEQAGALLGPIVAMKAPDLAQSTLRGLVSALKSEPSRRMIEGYVDALGARPKATVWHGSPHQFDAFDSSKIGTGEGAQAYGHGLYLAESPETAKHYQKLALRELGANPYDASVINRFMGKSSTPTNSASESLAAYALADAKKGPFLYDPIKAMKNLRDKAREARAPNPWMEVLGIEPQVHKTDFDAARKYIREFSDKTSRTGAVSHLYKVDLPDPLIARMLDWDKPLSQQNEHVRRALEPLGYRVDKSAVSAYDDALFSALSDEGPASLPQMPRNPMGADIARGNGVFDGPAQVAKAKALQQAGIPGIRYLDGGSRADGAGTSNFVVFPGEESALTILERNGKPVPLRDLLKGPAQATETRLNAATKPEYGIDHRPMTVEGGASQLHDLTPSFGDDIYGPNALQFFGSGDPREKSVVGLLKKIRGNPDALVTIYRGVPDGAPQTINPGDWITLDKNAASDYGHVVEMKVPASHVTSWADSLLEFGYYPPGKKP